MTERPRRPRHPAAASRILAGGLSVAAMLGLVAWWDAAPDVPDQQPPAERQPAVLRVVLTDPRIDPVAAATAAAEAASQGRGHALAPLSASAEPARSSGGRDAPHTATHAS